jgi:hypothetical protein
MEIINIAFNSFNFYRSFGISSSLPRDTCLLLQELIFQKFCLPHSYIILFFIFYILNFIFNIFYYLLTGTVSHVSKNAGIFDLCMYVMVSVPLISRMPWANRPNSLAHECSHTSFVARSRIRWRHSILAPVNSVQKVLVIPLLRLDVSYGIIAVFG